MGTRATRAPIELIPSQPQTLWGVPAVANFVCGGLGAGLYLAAALAAGFAASPALTLAAWLGPLLVLAGFAAVATEARRPLRGPRALARVRTSWMSRELWLGGAFVALAAGEFVAPGVSLRLAAAAAGTTLPVAQGFILRRARGISAWDVAPMPAVFLASAAVSGAGLLWLAEVVSGRAPAGMSVGGTMVLLVLGAVVWLAFVTWTREESFRRATRPLREGRAALAIVGSGYVAPFLLLALALALPRLTIPAVTLASALMVFGQVRAKSVLILEAGRLRPVTLVGLRLDRRSS